MSASAPLGTPSRNTGSVEADCTRATITGALASEVMSQAAATSFIHMHTLAVTHTPHSMRKTGWASGAQAVTGAMLVAADTDSPALVGWLMYSKVSPPRVPLRAAISPMQPRARGVPAMRAMTGVNVRSRERG